MPTDGISGFNSLELLSVPNSAISGSIPMWLSKCRTLKVLDLSRNQLTGRIPPWIGTLSRLFYLDLSNNLLRGEITMNLTQLAELISHHQFFNPNQHLEEIPFKQLFNQPYKIDLSNNRLSGPIWPEFGRLIKLQMFDLSWNNISGIIPANLSKMKELEILDLSHNDLSGEIPSSLTKLHFLSKFDVAYNGLGGRIPDGGQFSTFPESSFEGNLGLCGEFVLRCSDHVHKPADPNTVEGNEEEEGDSIFGLPFAIGTATGFVLAVWVSVFCRKFHCLP